MSVHYSGLVIKKEDITNSLSHLVGIVGRQNAIQQLSHVKIESVGGNQIRLTTTDMDISVMEIIKVENCNIGTSFTLPALTLYDIVKKFPNGSLIVLNQSEHSVEITANSVFFALPFLEGDNFPTIDKGDLSISFFVSKEEFIQLFNKTKFVISTEESRYNLTGLYLHAKDGELKSAATDGHRLALTSIRSEVERFGVLISRKTILELVKIFEKSEEIKASVSSNKVMFESGNITMISKLIAATFPHYEEVIPKKYEKEILINKQNFIEAIDRVSSIYVDKSKSVRLLFFNDTLKISASTSDSSNSHETLDIDYDDESFDIRFNYTYLLEMLSNVNSDTVKVHFNDGKSAAMIGNGNTTYIIMPMSV